MKDDEHKVVQHLFMSAGHIYVFLGGNVYSDPLSIFKISFFFNVEVYEFFVYFTY